MGKHKKSGRGPRGPRQPHGRQRGGVAGGGRGVGGGGGATDGGVGGVPQHAFKLAVHGGRAAVLVHVRGLQRIPPQCIVVEPTPARFHFRTAASSASMRTLSLEKAYPFGVEVVVQEGGECELANGELQVALPIARKLDHVPLPVRKKLGGPFLAPLPGDGGPGDSGSDDEGSGESGGDAGDGAAAGAAGGGTALNVALGKRAREGGAAGAGAPSKRRRVAGDEGSGAPARPAKKKTFVTDSGAELQRIADAVNAKLDERKAQLDLKEQARKRAREQQQQKAEERHAKRHALKNAVAELLIEEKKKKKKKKKSVLPEEPETPPAGGRAGRGSAALTPPSPHTPQPSDPITPRSILKKMGTPRTPGKGVRLALEHNQVHPIPARPRAVREAERKRQIRAAIQVKQMQRSVQPHLRGPGKKKKKRGPPGRARR